VVLVALVLAARGVVAAADRLATTARAEEVMDEVTEEQVAKYGEVEQLVEVEHSVERLGDGAEAVRAAEVEGETESEV